MLRSAVSTAQSVGLVQESFPCLAYMRFHRILRGILYRSRSSTSSEEGSHVKDKEHSDQNKLENNCSKIIEEKDQQIKDKETVIKELEV